MTGPHDPPSAADLVEAVREFFEGDVMDVLDGRKRYLTRVAVNVLGTVEREIRLGAEQIAEHQRGLQTLGVADEAELARAIRDGRLDARMDEVRRFVEGTVRAKLQVANPRYLESS